MDRKPIINLADVPLQDTGNGQGFAAKVGSFGPSIGSTGIGAMLHVVEPGKKAFPYHAHHQIHELFIILEGEGEYRFGSERYPVKEGDVLAKEMKLVKIKGEFPWHHHEHEDEMFFVWRGQVRLDFRDHAVTLNEGEALVVPRGVEHRPVAAEEAQIFLFEPKGVLNTGNGVDEIYTAPQGATV